MKKSIIIFIIMCCFLCGCQRESDYSLLKEKYNKTYENMNYYKDKADDLAKDKAALENDLKSVEKELNILKNSESYKAYEDITKAQEELAGLKNEIKELQQQVNSFKEKIDSNKNKSLEFIAGEFVAGKDFPVGRYLIYDGTSNFCTYFKNGNINIHFILGNENYAIKEYLHYFVEGETIESKSPFKLKLIE